MDQTSKREVESALISHKDRGVLHPTRNLGLGDQVTRMMVQVMEMETQYLRVVIRQSTREGQRMIIRGETSDVAVEKDTYPTLLCTLILRPSMVGKLPKGQTPHSFKLVVEEVVLGRYMLKQ